VLFVINAHQEGDQGSSGGEGLHDKKEFGWGGERPLHLSDTQEVSNFNWGVLKYKELPRNLRPIATTGHGLLCSQNDPQIRPQR
jgi:hypothetical protein